jgi:hypothetical protein
MRPVVPLISHPASLCLLPALVLTVLYGALQGTRGDVSGYWVGVFSSATVFSVFSCVFASLSAALSAARVRRARLLRSATTRRSILIVWATAWPCAAFAALIQCVGLLIAARDSWGSPGRVPWEVVLAWIVMIGLHTLIGYLLGVWLPPALAAPFAVTSSYLWLGFTWSIDYVPLRYLSGLVLSGCCPVYADLAARAPLTVIVFSAGMIVVGIAVLDASTRLRRRALAASAAASVAAPVLTLSLVIAHGLGAYPSPPRTGEQLQCAPSGPATVCLFPEQLWNTAVDVRAVAGRALAGLEQAGIDTPPRVSAAVEHDRVESAWLVYRHDFTEDTTIRSLASALLPQREEGESCPRDDADVDTMLAISELAEAGLYRTMTGRPDPAAPAADAVLAKLDPAPRTAWLNAALRALRDCSHPYPRVPAPLP